MGITRAVIGAVAAAGVARLLAPHETDEMMKTAKRAVTGTAAKAKRKAKTATRAASKAMPKMSSRKSSSKTAAKRKSTTTRKAAKRPARK